MIGGSGLVDPGGGALEMGEGDKRSRNQATRDETDESLRIEREKADSAAETKQRALEEEADNVVRSDRLRADAVVQAARGEADRERPRSKESELQRRRADVELEHERSRADAVLERQRALKRRYLADCLATERQATDNHLEGERAHADAAALASEQSLADVSHDLRSLLAALLMHTELLIARMPGGAAGDPVRQYATAAQRLVGQMNRMVNDLLDVSSHDTGRLAIERKELKLVDLVRDALEAFEPIAAANHIRLVATTHELPCHARVDGDRILQVLANLVTNAIKFTPAEGEITLALRCDGSKVLHFAVSDTGIGIPEAAVPTLFDRFRQVRPDPRGLGLGLYISRSIVEAHGGKIWVESRVGAGTTFHFTVPTHQLPYELEGRSAEMRRNGRD
jgi:signal transduction histidine kinase